jgi:hypothetical protein
MVKTLAFAVGDEGFFIALVRWTHDCQRLFPDRRMRSISAATGSTKPNPENTLCFTLSALRHSTELGIGELAQYSKGHGFRRDTALAMPNAAKNAHRL